LAALLTSCVTFSANPSFALNWEGHEDWFNESVLMEDMMKGIAPPLAKTLPHCELLRKRHEDNSYEQVALPGKNCVEKKGF
jgi:hypothetical protein